jgi:hypothetical protein
MESPLWRTLQFWIQNWSLVGHKRCPCNRPWRRIRFCNVRNPTFSIQLAHRWRWGFKPFALTGIFTSRKIPGSIFVRGWVDSRATVRLEWLRQLKNPITLLGIESATFRLVALCLLRYRPRLLEINSGDMFGSRYFGEGGNILRYNSMRDKSVGSRVHKWACK